MNGCRYYLATSRELKRLDAVTRSPIFDWFSESLAGSSTIRAFNQQSIFIASNWKRIDHNQICYLSSVSVNRWLSVRLEFLGAIIILIVALLAMSALITTGVDAGLVGLVLSYALNTTSALVSESNPSCATSTFLTLYQELGSAFSKWGRTEHCQCWTHITPDSGRTWSAAWNCGYKTRWCMAVRRCNWVSVRFCF